MKTPSTHPALAAGSSLRSLTQAAARCTACPLYAPATQTVFGEGAAHAALMLVGEQPGDREDLAGHPFVGPAGGVLDQALAAAGIPRGSVYLTNAVKHFSFVQKGKLRLHQKPRASEVRACTPWLVAELRVVRPRVVVALGATAAQALVGSDYKVKKDHGRPLPTAHAESVVLTYHPSAVLRASDARARAELQQTLVDDLRVAFRLAERTDQHHIHTL